MLFFLVFRIVFFLYHHAVFNSFTFFDLARVVWNGLYMDISMTSYLLVIPILFWSLGFGIKSSLWMKIYSTFHLLSVLLLGLILTVDLEIFNNWGHRLDAAVLPYLKYPKEAMASSFSSPIRILFTIFGLSFMIPMMIWVSINKPIIKDLRSDSSPIFLIGLILCALLIIPIRGGFQLAPINQSSVHFSTNRVLNQAAENPLWVLFQSILESGQAESLKLEYVKFKESSCDSLYQNLYPTEVQKPPFLTLTPKPNVVIIIWESLTAKVVGSFGGTYPCTPNFDRIANQGIKFTNFYATGDRSDKGLASILSSVPAVGKMSIMSQPGLVAKLPFLPKSFKKSGYNSTFMYGGELEFANMKNYMLEAGFDKLIGKKDFSSENYNSKWGAHDEVVLNKQLEIAKTEKEPFFHTLFTLSSHEPFEVPGEKINEKEPLDSLFCRAHRYTDKCIGSWFAKAQKASWWKNTIVIIVADHGHSLPNRSNDDNPLKFRIPMIWTGGQLTHLGSQVNDMAGSQPDIASTLLSQLNLDATDFRFSRNLFDQTKSGFAYFAFRNGNVFLSQNGKVLSPNILVGNLYQQKVYQNFYLNKLPVKK